MRRLLVFTVFFCPLAHGQEASRVRHERGRFWIQCQSAALEEALREIAVLSPMELWLDEELSEKRVSASVERATLKQALEALFEEAKDVNYILTFDPLNPERVTKVYAGGAGGGRLGREPTVASSEPEVEPEDAAALPPELDPEALLASPEAQDALGGLRDFFDQESARQTGEEGAAGEEPSGPLSPELEELLKSLPQNEKPKRP